MFVVCVVLNACIFYLHALHVQMYIDTTDPAAAKKIGSKVAGVNGSNWDTAKNDIMKDLITKKFTYNDDLKAELLATGNKAMVESGRDPHYACMVSHWGHNCIFDASRS